MEKRSHIQINHFEKNWLPVKNSVDQCIAVTVYNFKNNLSPVCMSDIYTLNCSPVVKTRRSTDLPRKSISYLGSKIWNGLDKNIKTYTSTNNFKHALELKKTICIYISTLL